MARSWSGALVIVAAAVVLAGGTASALDAAGASAKTATVATSVVESSTGGNVGGAKTAAEPVAPAADARTQTIRLEIRGGELTIEPDSLVVDLDRRGDVLRGELPDVTIVDARGTLAGWRARVQMAEVVGLDGDGVSQRVAPGRLRLVPTAPSAVAGNIGEVSAGRPIRGSGNGVLVSARRGGGGGTFVGGGTIELTGSPALEAATVTIGLSVR